MEPGRRSKNFTEREKMLLIEVAKEFVTIIDNKKTDATSVEAKKEAWVTLANKYNAVSETGARTEKQLHALYDNLKKKARKNLSDDKVYTRGWVDTRKNLSDILKADVFLSKLVSRNATIPLIKSDTVESISAAIQIFCGARYLAHKLSQRSLDYVKSVMIGELMSPVLPKSLSLSTEEANKEFIFVCDYLLKNETIYNRGRTGANWTAEITQLMESTPTAEKVPVPDLRRMTIENYQQFLLWLAYTIPKAQCMSPLQLIVTSYIGSAKRGTVSERFIEKISNGIKDDIGEDVTLDIDVIHTTYNNFGRYINADNAKEVFSRWLEDLPEHALRLRLTLEQVSGSGLTAFLITGRAIKKFINFPWSKLDKLTGNEVTNFLDAIRVVDGNPYYGFNRDLKAAKSTNFSTIAFVAKELLIQISGEASLKNYQGWMKKPKSPVVIKKMIDDFVTRYNEELMNAEATQAEITEQRFILDAVASESNINLFS